MTARRTALRGPRARATFSERSARSRSISEASRAPACAHGLLEHRVDHLLPVEQRREPVADAVGALDLAGAPRELLPQQRVAQGERPLAAERGERRRLPGIQRGVDDAEHREGAVAGDDREEREREGPGREALLGEPCAPGDDGRRLPAHGGREQRAVHGEPPGGQMRRRRAEGRAQPEAPRALVADQQAGAAQIQEDRGGVQQRRADLEDIALAGELLAEGEQRREQRRARALRGEEPLAGEQRAGGAGGQIGGTLDQPRRRERQAAHGAAQRLVGERELAGQLRDPVDVGRPLEREAAEQRAGGAGRGQRRREAVQAGVAAEEDGASLGDRGRALALAASGAAARALGSGGEEAAQLGDAGGGAQGAAPVVGQERDAGEAGDRLLDRRPAFRDVPVTFHPGAPACPAGSRGFPA